ncbi:MAG: AAA family ATPase [Bacteroidales bacterium]
MDLQTTSKLEMAARFINQTASHVFLTGKAGTGKTTFLRNLGESTHKTFLIVAPTGIAALNAGGVTIHSQFLLPFGSFLPEPTSGDSLPGHLPFFTRQSLTRVHTLNSMRKKVLRATELLIIDEVSMLRADILDAIDFRMRSARGDFSRSFGGAQVLMIGDLHQLPPIVKEEEWQVLRNHYPSMHFFEALAFRKERMVCIELDRIFRQRDDRFIGVLNHLRDNVATEEDIALLNSHYRETTDEEAIIITTHNRTADGINRKKMDALPAGPTFFEAVIEGDFPEKLYPLPERIELKPGARIMFVRNDSGEEKAYVNGSLARVLEIEDDEVTVEMQEDGSSYVLKTERWENKKYSVDEESNEVVEEVTGSFTQFPVKPAWAVTVHKSQGLTFDRAVIDVGQAFAPGQVYVALSRLRSLDGLTLRTRISPACIQSDVEVGSFFGRVNEQEALPGLLRENQRTYLERLVEGCFDFTAIERMLHGLEKNQGKKMEFADEEMRGAMARLADRFAAEKKNTALFRKQLQSLLQSGKQEQLLERIRKGRTYYLVFMEENLKQVLFHAADVEQLTRTKTYRNLVGEIEQQIRIALAGMETVEFIAGRILSGSEFSRDDLHAFPWRGPPGSSSGRRRSNRPRNDSRRKPGKAAASRKRGRNATRGNRPGSPGPCSGRENRSRRSLRRGTWLNPPWRPISPRGSHPARWMCLPSWTRPGWKRLPPSSAKPRVPSRTPMHWERAGIPTASFGW